MDSDCSKNGCWYARQGFSSCSSQASTGGKCILSESKQSVPVPDKAFTMLWECPQCGATLTTPRRQTPAYCRCKGAVRMNQVPAAEVNQHNSERGNEVSGFSIPPGMLTAMGDLQEAGLAWAEAMAQAFAGIEQTFVIPAAMVDQVITDSPIGRAINDAKAGERVEVQLGDCIPDTDDDAS